MSAGSRAVEQFLACPEYDCRDQDDPDTFEVWLDGGVKSHSSTERIATYPVWMGRHEADVLLQRNASNRNVTKGNATRLLVDMQGGTFYESPDPIAVDESGQLVSGQHRMIALKAYNKPLPFQFAFNVNRQHSIATVDQQRKRTPDQILKSLGLPTMASSLRAYYFAPQVHEFTPPNEELVALHDLVGESLSELHDSLKTFKGYSAITNQAAIMAALLRATPYADNSDIVRFGQIYITGPAYDTRAQYEKAPLVLRDKLLKEPGKGSAESRAVNYMRTTKALHAFLEKRAIKSLRLSPQRSKWPDLFPLPANVQKLRAMWDQKRRVAQANITKVTTWARKQQKEARK